MTDSTGDAPARRSAETTRAAILRSARDRFAAHGYERTTIRAVAADAQIDPSMVMRYFGSKEQLFDAALTVDLHLPDLSAVPPAELPELMVRHFLHRWEHAPADDALLMLLRSGVTNEKAAARLHEVFARQVAPALVAAVGPQAAARAGGVVAAQLLGVAVTRYLLRLPGVVALEPEQLVAALAPAIAATLGITPKSG
ncbi:TetR/AcrR family transcriptional regulator [Kitasatospora viridis]|uniref:TetR family transcriptional regulator n=1 Tax=Kitasatospora viridis TaxID=281105 RepID=A0A561UPN1_9ACTN|nr:TetR family transcriptional regulator [Kitasatospora viridis]TWG01325.1 TetR family transcriptional regulator [Kitasatospora viridis]